MLYNSFTASTASISSTPSNPPITASKQDALYQDMTLRSPILKKKLELFEKCYFTNMTIEEIKIYAKTFKRITSIRDPFVSVIVEPLKLSDMCIKSIKNLGYSNPDFTGDTITILDGENKECLEKTMRSVIIKSIR